MADKDITVDGNLTNMTAPAVADRLPIVDAGTGTLQDVTLENMLKVINDLTADANPSGTADYVVTYDASASSAKKVLVNNVFNPINDLTNDASPDVAADYVPSYDASAGTAKKVLMSALSPVSPTPIFLQHVLSATPLDATTYYMGEIGIAVSTTANQHYFTSRRAGTIYAIDLTFTIEGTLSSGETFTTYFRLNNTTDTVISSSCVCSSAFNRFSNTGLSIAIASGDTFEIKYVTPTWATNPTNIKLGVTIWMR